MALLLALAVVTACRSSSPTGVSTQPVQGQDIVVALRDTVALGDTGLRVGFRAVLHDSRCPIDAVCIWSGNAQIELDLIAPSAPPRVGLLNTDSGEKELVFTGYLIQLVGLDPAPQSNDTTRAYQARLRFRFLPD